VILPRAFLIAPIYVTGPINTGTYLITNARFLNVVILENADDGRDLVSDVQYDDPGEKVCWFRMLDLSQADNAVQ
jgi:hypothetical protein